jgi:hypothetical protein
LSLTRSAVIKNPWPLTQKQPCLPLEEDEMKKAIMVAALIAAFAAPAFAADEYYVVQDVKTKKCTIINEKPTESKTLVNAESRVDHLENLKQAFSR